MTASYNNCGGTTRRTDFIAVTSGMSFNPSSSRCSKLVDGRNTTNLLFFNANSSGNIQFDFNGLGTKVVIVEAKWYQDTNSAQGTWKWQGSNDASGWTDLSANFTLNDATGGSGSVIGDMSANTTPYRYYRMLLVSGSTNSTPFIRQIEFKLDVDPTDSTNARYGELATFTNRTSLITVTTDVTLGTGTIDKLVNNTGFQAILFFNSGQSGKQISFDFGATARKLAGALWFQDGSGSHGTWKWQYSDNGSSWTDIGSSTAFTLNDASGGSDDQARGGDISGDLTGNTTQSHRYWRMAQVSGTTTNGPFLYGIVFKEASNISPPAPASQRRDNIIILH